MTQITFEQHFKNIVNELNDVIEQHHSSVQSVVAKAQRVCDLILKLGRYLDQNKICEQSKISVTIKEILGNKIKERKITRKWIEECLPKEYKRTYTKSKTKPKTVSGDEVYRGTTGQAEVLARVVTGYYLNLLKFIFLERSTGMSIGK